MIKQELLAQAKLALKSPQILIRGWQLEKVAGGPVEVHQMLDCGSNTVAFFSGGAVLVMTVRAVNPTIRDEKDRTIEYMDDGLVMVRYITYFNDKEINQVPANHLPEEVAQGILNTLIACSAE